MKEEVLAKEHRAFLIMGSGHFLRRRGPGQIERDARASGASTYLIVFGTNVVGNYDDLDKRFDTFPLPSVIDLDNNWVGDLPAFPVLNGGSNLPSTQKLFEVADALLYLGPRDILTARNMPRSELEGTAYGEEIDRRMTIELGRPLDFKDYRENGPLFVRPRLVTPRVPIPLTVAPKSIHDPLPPRPPSR